MRGIFSTLPADTLAAAVAPIAERCAQLDWAVDLQSGPLRCPYWDEEDPANLLAYHHLEAGRPTQPMHWFGRGFLPRHADCLVLDEWSTYIGFDSTVVTPATLAEMLGRDMSPRPRLSEAVERAKLLYLLRVDTGWWEAYAADAEFLDRLRGGWAGTGVSSDRWNSGPPHHPLGHGAA